MVKKTKRTTSGKSKGLPEPPPILVQCTLQVPKDRAEALLPHLGIALDCGGAEVRRKRHFVEVETQLEIRTIADIVDKGVPVLVTKRIPISPIPADMLINDAAAWFKHIEKLK